MTDKKLKIMHVLGAKGSGGAELFYLRLVIALNKHCDVLCVVRENSWIASQLQEKGLAYKTAPFGGLFDFSTKKILKNYIHDFQPDVIQGWMNRACKAFPQTNIATVGRLGGYYNLKNYKKCDYLAGNTQGLQKYIIEQGWPADKSFYLPNFSPLPAAHFREQRQTMRQKYNLPQEARVLFIAGRLHKVKGIDVALRALPQLPDDVYLLIAGTGAEEASLKDLAQTLSVSHRVCFAGWVSNLSSVASATDIWLVPSRYEPLGNVVLDAWAHEIPLVAAAAAGPQSLIEHDVSGLLIPIDETDALTHAVARLLQDKNLSESLVQGGKKTLETSFSEAVIIKKYLKFYHQIS